MDFDVFVNSSLVGPFGELSWSDIEATIPHFPMVVLVVDDRPN
jgi:hypothetical protein